MSVRQKNLLLTSSLHVYAQFLTDVFDCEMHEVAAFKGFETSVYGQNYDVVESRGFKAAESLVPYFTLSFEQLHEWEEIVGKVSFYFYKSRAQESVPVVDEIKRHFDFRDIDGRIWRLELRAPR